MRLRFDKELFLWYCQTNLDQFNWFSRSKEIYLWSKCFFFFLLLFHTTVIYRLKRVKNQCKANELSLCPFICVHWNASFMSALSTNLNHFSSTYFKSVLFFFAVFQCFALYIALFLLTLALRTQFFNSLICF